MLENSIWKRYHEEKSIHQTLVEIYGGKLEDINTNEGELYAILKRHLTKKELRLFIMNEAGISKEEIVEEINIELGDFEKAHHKTYKKLRQNSMKEALKETNPTASEDDMDDEGEDS